MKLKSVNLVTSRSFNLTLNPVIKSKRKINFPYNFSPAFPLEVSDEWNAKNAMMLDVISDIIYNKMNPDEKSFSSIHYEITDDKIIDENFLKSLNKDLLNNYNESILVNDLFLWKNYPFLMGLSSTQLFNLLNNTSNCKIKGFIKVRVKNDNGSTKKHKLVSYKLNEFENIFNLDIVSQNNGNYKNEKYMKPRDREYKINFNSILGFILMQDIQTLNTDIINSNFYSLPEFAQFIYRKLMLTRKINTNIEIYLDELKSFLAVRSSDTHLKNMIEKNLNSLEDVGLIKWSRGKSKLIWYSLKKKGCIKK